MSADPGLAERVAALEDRLSRLCDALLRKESELDGNWGYPSFYDEVRQIAEALIRAEIVKEPV